MFVHSVNNDSLFTCIHRLFSVKRKWKAITQYTVRQVYLLTLIILTWPSFQRFNFRRNIQAGQSTRGFTSFTLYAEFTVHVIIPHYSQMVNPLDKLYSSQDICFTEKLLTEGRRGPMRRRLHYWIEKTVVLEGELILRILYPTWVTNLICRRLTGAASVTQLLCWRRCF